MKHLSRLAICGLITTAVYAQASAQTGYKPGNILMHLSLAGVLPEDLNSGTTLAGFNVKVSDSASPELDGSYFLTDALSVEAIAATTRHIVSVHNGATTVKVGSVWVLPPTVTLQYHFPQLGPVRAYAGLGVMVAFFYDPKKAADVTKEGGFSTGVGPALNVGFDVPISGRWVANVDVKQTFVVTGTHVDHGAVGAMTELDPTVVGVGVGYLF